MKVEKTALQTNEEMMGSSIFSSPVFPANKTVDLKPFTTRVCDRKA